MAEDTGWAEDTESRSCRDCEHHRPVTLAEATEFPPKMFGFVPLPVNEVVAGRAVVCTWMTRLRDVANVRYGRPVERRPAYVHPRAGRSCLEHPVPRAHFSDPVNSDYPGRVGLRSVQVRREGDEPE